jgi:hypothetical protein
MRPLSKSKLLSYRQCPKRLWLEIHRPELREDSTATQASFEVGNAVGEIARSLYDTAGNAVLIEAKRDGFAIAFAQSLELLDSSQPIFEAGFSAGGAVAFADIMLPVKQGRKRVWRMVEVKSSGSVKDYHRDDAAIQAFIARAAGVPLVSIALAHIDTDWRYPGGGDYQGLLTEQDLTEEAFSRKAEVQCWIADAQKCAAKHTEPKVRTGDQCSRPYECGFIDYCSGQEPQAKYPIRWLPRIQTKALKAHIADNGVTDLREVPDALLNDKQLRVKTHTLSGKTYFDKKGAAASLKPHGLPAYFLDFETIQFAVPIWKGTRPYQKIPFQFSLHRLARTGKLESQSFLDLSGKEPSKEFAATLIDACGKRGPVFVYNAGFEKGIIGDLAERFPKFRSGLLALRERIVDLHPVAEAHYYHPSQQGSWSIKNVLPAVAPELRYGALDGVQDGGMAMVAYLEAIQPDTPAARKAEIKKQLLDYCGLDTFAMVRIWQVFNPGQQMGHLAG